MQVDRVWKATLVLSASRWHVTIIFDLKFQRILFSVIAEIISIAEWTFCQYQLFFDMGFAKILEKKRPENFALLFQRELDSFQVFNTLSLFTFYHEISWQLQKMNFLAELIYRLVYLIVGEIRYVECVCVFHIVSGGLESWYSTCGTISKKRKLL